LLDKLEKRGLVARETSQLDRRSNHLFLTSEGRQLLNIASKRVRQHEQRILAGLTKTETKQLIHLLSKIAPADI
jgi:DNA-binding MarR family transcriptional regulator